MMAKKNLRSCTVIFASTGFISHASKSTLSFLITGMIKEQCGLVLFVKVHQCGMTCCEFFFLFTISMPIYLTVHIALENLGPLKPNLMAVMFILQELYSKMASMQFLIGTMETCTFREKDPQRLPPKFQFTSVQEYWLVRHSLVL